MQLADSQLVAKLTCLADMLGSFSDPIQRTEIFGSAEISEPLFDRWWSIRCIEHLGSTLDYGEELGYFSSQLRAPSNPRVVEWFARYAKPTSSTMNKSE